MTICSELGKELSRSAQPHAFSLFWNVIEAAWTLVSLVWNEGPSGDESKTEYQSSHTFCNLKPSVALRGSIILVHRCPAPFHRQTFELRRMNVFSFFSLKSDKCIDIHQNLVLYNHFPLWCWEIQTHFKPFERISSCFTSDVEARPPPVHRGLAQQIAKNAGTRNCIDQHRKIPEVDFSFLRTVFAP